MAAQEDTRDYAGDLDPDQAWALLARESAAALVDVRTQAEWRYVGLPDLDDLGKRVLCVSWQLFPDMGLNRGFLDEIRAEGLGREQPILLLCRSGQRSRDAAIALTQAGFSPCYNVAEGFEGPLDAARHRGVAGGWKARGLPWRQG